MACGSERRDYRPPIVPRQGFLPRRLGHLPSSALRETPLVRRHVPGHLHAGRLAVLRRWAPGSSQQHTPSTRVTSTATATRLTSKSVIMARFYKLLAISCWLLAASCQEGREAGDLWGQWRTDGQRYLSFSGSIAWFKANGVEVFGNFQHQGDSLFIQCSSIEGSPPSEDRKAQQRRPRAQQGRPHVEFL